MTTAKLAEYKNGDFLVRLYSDGTKVREGEGVAEFPESIDLKITDYCDMNCPYCHESSSRKGRDACLSDIYRIVRKLPPGVEIAIGGGNPLSHTFLTDLLMELAELGLIANLTVNWQHLDGRRIRRLNTLCHHGLIRGLGVSISSAADTQMFMEKQDFDDPVLESDNIVFHCILGEMSAFDVMRIPRPCKVLLLGDKRYGRGKEYFQNDETKISAWKYFLPSVLSREGLLLSFDNLAIEQLDLKNVIPKETWDEHYMGNDGQFTMYVDAVKQEYAVSSISPRRNVSGRSARELFKELPR
jgi:hypothetical protein